MKGNVSKLKHKFIKPHFPIYRKCKMVITYIWKKLWKMFSKIRSQRDLRSFFGADGIFHILTFLSPFAGNRAMTRVLWNPGPWSLWDNNNRTKGYSLSNHGFICINTLLLSQNTVEVGAAIYCYCCCCYYYYSNEKIQGVKNLSNLPKITWQAVPTEPECKHVSCLPLEAQPLNHSIFTQSVIYRCFAFFFHKGSLQIMTL